MLQLKTPLSQTESEMLLQCLSEMENNLMSKNSSSNQDMLKRTTLASAKQKVQSQMYDCFYHEEIANMVFALDSLSRKYNAQLTESTPTETAESVSTALRTVAVTRAKLRQASTSK
ncbi:MAG: hypothetical protein Q4D42_04420 [Eubacteriales bacterium]|nr:hypothetical protein [Eubacteriales bacterium]